MSWSPLEKTHFTALEIFPLLFLFFASCMFLILLYKLLFGKKK